MENRVWIYALNCPITCQVKYVGKSKNPTGRLQTHLAGHDSNSNREWLLALKQQGIKPTISLLEKVPGEQGAEAESRWINLLKQHGHELTNQVYKGAKRK